MALDRTSIEAFLNTYTPVDKTMEMVIIKYLRILSRQDIAVINRWTSHADVPLDVLLALHKKLKDIEPVEELVVYRGIGFGLSYQEKMDLFEKRFMGYSLKPHVKKHHKFTYRTPRPLSFSDDIKTARAFGKCIVTTVLDRTIPYIRMTEAFYEAANRLMATSLFQETILLDTSRAIEYTVVEI